ncbi:MULTISPECIES: ABC transporter permease [Pseudonocardia]|uniref:ABC transporter permease n=2 Tax=Pseudonocardia TaxID=1847 RepID=A0ABQ0RX74_9PSEU|nr:MULTISPECIES: ABC transporter permease [Pseudonocardia]OSY40391.1 putative aliphatic sulfonates transport permease protein SsuC [Pseudonocardia autotrophica]TDN72278.1 NitT/TauT family transport system permease protein [Pseudonocardia autotrophica]BBG02990.1 ABC transporter permease [Pseudonocardia autotrophica]GEC25108.1 ABC transporter permease [Pseudonocardia saturnea]
MRTEAHERAAREGTAQGRTARKRTAPATTAQRTPRTVRREPGSATGRRRLSDLPGGLLAGGTVVLLLVLWEVGVRGLGVSQILLPAPSRIAEALYQGFATGPFLEHTWVTLQEILYGFAIAVVTGLLVAVLVTSSTLAEKIVLPIVVVLQTVPKVALAPLLLVWFGFGMESKIVTTALIAFFPVLVNATLGFNATSTDQIHMMRSFGATRRQILLKLRFPTAVPSIVAGLDVAVVLSVIGAIVAEFVGAQAGLGYLIMASNTSLDVATMFAVLVVLSVIGLVLHYAVVLAGHRLAFWSEANRTRATTP